MDARSSEEAELYSELRDLYRRWKDDFKYPANRFIQKLESDGPVRTAVDLVTDPKRSKGFLELQSRGLLDLTVEATVLRDEFRPLFSPEVLEAARQKLRAADMKI